MVNVHRTLELALFCENSAVKFCTIAPSQSGDYSIFKIILKVARRFDGSC